MQNFWQNPAVTVPYHRDTYTYISPSKYEGSLTNNVVLITGAGRGIGRATALAFAAAGANVACLSRTKSDVEAVVEEIEKRGHPKALAAVGDVTDAGAPSRISREVEASLGPVGILINNAGVSRISDMEHEKNMEAAWKVTEVNMKGTMAFTHAVLPSMMQRKRGVIINVVSVLATLSLPYFSVYSAAKAGIIRATEIWDMEFRQHGIYTYALHPAMTLNTTLGVGALNETAHKEVEGMRTFVTDFVASEKDTVKLPADTMVALAADPDARHLSGKYIDGTQDLGAVLAEAKKGSDGRIEKEKLYSLKIDTL
ncbi:hypothetical protein MMC21_002518 [Puttea exsequens]|nr:hypothetical protein [Puttea exsequens]